MRRDLSGKPDRPSTIEVVTLRARFKRLVNASAQQFSKSLVPKIKGSSQDNRRSPGFADLLTTVNSHVGEKIYARSP